MIWVLLLICVVSYLLGSINSAILVSRLLAGEDIRSHGSGNAGATNMLRTYGRKAALLTTLGDLVKAMAAVLLARFLCSWLAADPGFDPGYLAGFFVLAGHVFPVYFHFRGGKGVMPALGVILLVHPPAFAVLAVLAIPVFLLTRTMSVVSLTSACLLPGLIGLIDKLQQKDWLAPFLFALACSVLVIVSHRTNIRRLLEGKEQALKPRAGSDKK